MAFGEGSEKKIEPAPAWTVVTGELRHEPTAVALLQTEKMFENYELSLEYQIPEGARIGRIGSGVLLGSEDAANRFVIECDVGFGVTGKLVILSDASFGSKERSTTGRELVSAKSNAERPQGAWNERVIRCEGKKTDVRLNGKPINEAVCDKPLKANIGLQGSFDTTVRYRNLRLKAFGKAPTS